MKSFSQTRMTLRVFLSGLLVLGLLAFIFSNSLQNGEESNQRSGAILQLVQRILDPTGKIPEETLHYFVRKTAHFTEFAMLGAALWLFTDSLRLRYGMRYPFCAPFGALAAAVTDEYIQHFTGRTSLVQDVLLDFSGALFGLLTVCLLAVLIRKRKCGKSKK